MSDDSSFECTSCMDFYRSCKKKSVSEANSNYCSLLSDVCCLQKAAGFFGGGEKEVCQMSILFNFNFLLTFGWLRAILHK